MNGRATKKAINFFWRESFIIPLLFLPTQGKFSSKLREKLLTLSLMFHDVSILGNGTLKLVQCKTKARILNLRKRGGRRNGLVQRAYYDKSNFRFRPLKSHSNDKYFRQEKYYLPLQRRISHHFSYLFFIQLPQFPNVKTENTSQFLY